MARQLLGILRVTCDLAVVPHRHPFLILYRVFVDLGRSRGRFLTAGPARQPPLASAGRLPRQPSATSARQRCVRLMLHAAGSAARLLNGRQPPQLRRFAVQLRQRTQRAALRAHLFRTMKTKPSIYTPSRSIRRKPFSTYSRNRGLDASHVIVLRSRPRPPIAQHVAPPRPRVRARRQGWPGGF